MPDILSPLSTALPKRTETTEAPQQPSDMSEGSGDAIDKSMKILFPQHGSDHHESTTQSAEHNHSSQQPSTESKESDMSEASRETSDKFLMTLFPQRGESTTQGGSHTQRPHTETTESMTEGSGEFTIFPQGSGEHITSIQSSTSTETTESMIEGSGEFTISLQDDGERFTNTESSTSIALVTESEGSGSDDAEFTDEGKMSPVSTTQSSSLTRNIAPRLMPESNMSEQGVQETQDPQTRTGEYTMEYPQAVPMVEFILSISSVVIFFSYFMNHPKISPHHLRVQIKVLQVRAETIPLIKIIMLIILHDSRTVDLDLTNPYFLQVGSLSSLSSLVLQPWLCSALPSLLETSEILMSKTHYHVNCTYSEQR